MYNPHISLEEFLRLAEGKDGFVRLDIMGPGNPIPEFLLPKGLKRETAMVIQVSVLGVFHELYAEYLGKESKLWQIKETIARHTEEYMENIAAATIMVFRDAGFLYKLHQRLTSISAQHNIDIRLFWRGQEFMKVHEFDPKFEIPEPTFLVCPLCRKRFVPRERGGRPQRFCMPEHEKKTRFRRAYLRRKQGKGTLSEQEMEELHGLKMQI